MRRAAGSGVLTDEIRSHPPVNSVVRAEARRPRLLHWRWRQGLVIAVAVRTGGGKNKKDKRSSDASGPLCGLPERGSRPPPNAPRIPPLLGNRARRRSIRSNPAKHQAGSVDSSALPSLHLRLSASACAPVVARLLLPAAPKAEAGAGPAPVGLARLGEEGGNGV